MGYFVKRTNEYKLIKITRAGAGAIPSFFGQPGTLRSKAHSLVIRCSP